MKIIKNTNEFNELINDGLVLVDFFATWCGPCTMLVPELEIIQNTNSNDLKIIKVDVDQITELAEKYEVQSLPTMVLFKNGKEVDRKIGYLASPKIQEFINQNK